MLDPILHLGLILGPFIKKSEKQTTMPRNREGIFAFSLEICE
jgi:hypothetical protein